MACATSALWPGNTVPQMSLAAAAALRGARLRTYDQIMGHHLRLSCQPSMPLVCRRRQVSGFCRCSSLGAGPCQRCSAWRIKGAWEVHQRCIAGRWRAVSLDCGRCPIRVRSAGRGRNTRVLPAHHRCPVSGCTTCVAGRRAGALRACCPRSSVAGALGYCPAYSGRQASSLSRTCPSRAAAPLAASSAAPGGPAHGTGRAAAPRPGPPRSPGWPLLSRRG